MPLDYLDRERIEEIKRTLHAKDHGYNASNDPGRVLRYTPRPLEEKLQAMQQRAAREAQEASQQPPEAGKQHKQRGGLSRKMRHARKRSSGRRRG